MAKPTVKVVSPLISEVQPWPHEPAGGLITTQRPLKPVKWNRRWRRIKVRRLILYYQLSTVEISPQRESPNIFVRARNGLQLTLSLLDKALVDTMFREEFHQAPYFHMTGEELEDTTLCSVVGPVWKNMDQFESEKLQVYDTLLLQLWLKSITTIQQVKRLGMMPRAIRMIPNPFEDHR